MLFVSAKAKLATNLDLPVEWQQGLRGPKRLDVFGELENERKAGSANQDAANEDADVWRLILISDVVSAYVGLRFSQELIRVTKRVNQSRRKTLKETKKLAEEGQAIEISVAQAEALLATSRASMPVLEVSFIRSLNRIIALVGVTELISSREFDETAPQPLPRTTIVQTGVPSDLIRNRPDIRRAEKRLQSALAGVGATQAELNPGFILTGNIAVNGSSTGPAVNAGFFRVGFDLHIFAPPHSKGTFESISWCC